MLRLELFRRQSVKYAAYLLAALLLGVGLLCVVLVRVAGDGAGAPAWASPSVMALRRVSAVDSAQHESNFLNNLDCTLMTYRLTASNVMQTGCFTETAFGLVDSDSDTVIFNGTDEGLPLLPYWPSQVLVPWPGALNMVVLDAASTGGSYLSMYKNPLASLQDQRDPLLRLSAKKLTAPPDLILRDATGKQLVVNAQTLAFSDSGSWLVVETLNGSFVRINLATLDMVAFAPAFGSQGSPALLNSQVAVSDDGHYVAIGNKDAASLKVYDLAACDGVVDNLKPQNCAAHDYFGFARQQIDGLQAIRHLRFVNDGLLSFEAQTSDPATSGVYELAPQANITSLIDYLGLGDSYTSGEGAFDYLGGTDTADDMCHLSARSYPLLLTHDLFSAAGGHSVACSGAVINDVGSISPDYKGQVRGIGNLTQLQQTQAALLNSIMTNYVPGYVAQQRFVKQYQPAVTTVSVGGDDIGFGDILQKCVEPHVSLHLSANTCYSTYEDRLELTKLIDRTVPRWTALYKQLLAEAPGTQLYTIGYPQIADDKGDCALNVHLNKSELEFSEELIDYLNGGIRQAAEASGVTYVDISQALAGHRLCEAASYDVAINGLTAGTDAGVFGLKIFGKESYHPNALGQALMEQAILQQTHNLTLVSPPTPVNTSSQAILDAPKTGRTVNTLMPDDNLIASLVPIGRSTPVQASGTRDGLRPNTTYTVRLDGPSGPAVGTTTSNAGGDISASITLPGNTAVGGHTIDITGDNQAGEPVDVTQPIYVPANDNDADGDGIPDSLDTCPGAAASGQDSDQDGVDDSCDTLIGPPPDASGQSGSGALSGSSNSGSSGGSTDVGQTETGNNLGSIVLDGPILSAVASFEPDSSSATVAQLSGQIVNNTSGTAQVLGTATANPATVATKNLKLPVKPQPGKLPRPLTKLYIINWLPWAVLPIIIWLLILLGLHVKRLFGRPGWFTRKNVQNQPVSTTISL